MSSEQETRPDAPSTDAAAAEPQTPEEWRKALEAERARAEANMSGWQRAQADYQNYKRRVEQERTDLVRYAGASALLQFLTTVDDLERAFTALPASLASLTWVEGVGLIYRKLLAILESQGVREIEAENQPFDPQLHEAIAQGEGPEGQVMQVIQRGYYLHDRVLRPALVQVGNGAAGPGEEADRKARTDGGADGEEAGAEASADQQEQGE